LVSKRAEGAMRNPFTEVPDGESEDLDLVRRAQEGSREVLEHLITRHQAWIYNIALRMVYLPEDTKPELKERPAE
jgi:hypothetical protein